MSPLLVCLKRIARPHFPALFFGISLIVRMWLVFIPGDHGQLRWDEPYYNLLASRIVRGYGFSFPTDAYHTAIANHPTSFQEPLYPVVLAVVYQLFGIRNYTAAYLIQAVLGAVTVLIVFWLAKHVFGLWTAVLAAGIASLYPPLLFFGRLLMTDTLFILLLMTTVLLTLLSTRRAPGLSDLVTGLFIGFGVLTRSVMLAILAMLILFHVWLTWQRKSSVNRLVARTFLLIVPVFLVIAPWTVRNYRVHDTFILVSTKLGYNLYFYNYPSNDYRFNERVVPFPDVSKLREPEREKLLRTTGLHFIRSSPTTFAKYALLKFLDFWRPLPSERNSRTLERVIALVFFPPIAVLGLVGLFLASRSPLSMMRDYAMLSLALLALWLVQAMVFTGGFKARIGIEPTLIIFASYALTRLVAKSRKYSTTHRTVTGERC